MPAYQGIDQTQHQPQPSMSPATSSSQVDAFQPYRRDSGQVSALPGSTYPQYPSSAFATSHMPQYTGYTPSYAQPPAFTSPYQPPQPQNTKQPRQQPPHHHTHAAYAPMHSQPQQYMSNEGTSQDDGDNSDGGVSVPPSY